MIFGDGSQTRDFTTPAKTVTGLCQAAECDALVGRTINLGSGVETSVSELAKIIFSEVGLSHIKPSYQPPRPGDVQRHLADVRVGEELLGFNTRVNVREGIRRLLDHVRSQLCSAADLLAETNPFNWQPLGELVT